MERMFLDPNILFSAAYTPDSRLLELWALPDVELVTCTFALEEARRNLLIHNQQGVVLLDELSANMTVVPSVAASDEFPDDVKLAEKDVPILLAALKSGCSHLLTGDKRHFGALYGRRISGVLVQTPAQYLRSRAG